MHIALRLEGTEEERTSVDENKLAAVADRGLGAIALRQWSTI